MWGLLSGCLFKDVARQVCPASLPRNLFNPFGPAAFAIKCVLSSAEIDTWEKRGQRAAASMRALCATWNMIPLGIMRGVGHFDHDTPQDGLNSSNSKTRSCMSKPFYPMNTNEFLSLIWSQVLRWLGIICRFTIRLSAVFLWVSILP